MVKGGKNQAPVIPQQLLGDWGLYEGSLELGERGWKV